MTGPQYGWSPGDAPTVVGVANEARPTAPAPRSGVWYDGVSAYRSTRRTRLRIARVDPWSVLKVAFVVSLLVVVVAVVAVFTLYAMLAGMGVFDLVNRTLADVTGAAGSSWQLVLSPGWVLVVTLLIGLVDVLLLTALATVSAFGYNLIASLVGGVEVTLAETE